MKFHVLEYFSCPLCGLQRRVGCSLLPLQYTDLYVNHVEEVLWMGQIACRLCQVTNEQTFDIVRSCRVLYYLCVAQLSVDHIYTSAMAA